MRIELADLQQGTNAFAHDYAPGELVWEDERISLLKAPSVAGAIQLDGKSVVISGRVRAAAQLECDRCLKPVEHSLDSRFKVTLVTPQEYEAQRAVELTDEDLDLEVFDGETIVVDDLVAEELMLGLPDHVLCKEDCKGICAVCGSDRNVVACECETQPGDPRWNELKRLVNGK